MTKNIYFVRHGESTDNLNGLVGGAESDSQLTEQGIQQAKDTATTLQGIVFDLVVASPLIRARDTAKEIMAANGITAEIVIKPEFIEKYVGEFAGKPYPEYKAYKLSGGTSGESEVVMQKRVWEGLTWLKAQQFQNALIVSHSATIANVRAIVDAIPLSELAAVPRLGNAEIYKITVDQIPDLK